MLKRRKADLCVLFISFVTCKEVSGLGLVSQVWFGKAASEGD